MRVYPLQQRKKGIARCKCHGSPNATLYKKAEVAQQLDDPKIADAEWGFDGLCKLAIDEMKERKAKGEPYRRACAHKPHLEEEGEFWYIGRNNHGPVLDNQTKLPKVINHGACKPCRDHRQALSAQRLARKAACSSS